jgi:hypothetical protein
MNAEMHIENGKMVYGKRDCSTCMGSGTRPTKITCRTCKGTGNGKRGGLRQCKTCYGNTHEYDHVNRVDCPDCKAKGLDPLRAQDTTAYDTLPQDIWESLEFRVVRQDQRKQSWAEQYLALGCVYSVTDYGRHSTMTDSELIAEVKKPFGHQACKVVDKDNNVAKFIAIITSDNGYTPVAVFESEVK